MLDDWQDAIANADMADWVTVATYLAAALLAARAANYAWLRREHRENAFWRLTAILMVLLGINELLDLQVLLTTAGRAYARSAGWYGEHRPVQYVFVVSLAACAMFIGIVTVWLMRSAHRAVRLAILGLIFIGLFVLLRAASFHHFDDFLGRGHPVFNLGSIQELAGILVVAVAAALYPRRRAGLGGRRGSR